ncbi:MAG: 3-phosphoshikimate 1-carboxyvinyltransferase [Thermoproteota archaeon]|jgi:3-phosphoshikimate 1-carboxyvinyltransferase
MIEILNNREELCLEIPGSKSIINRLLILAALSKDDITIHNINECSDILSMISCLEKLGLECVRDKSSLIIKNQFPNSGDFPLLNIGDGGTTYRFLLVLLSLSDKRINFRIDNELKARPHEDLYRQLQNLGCELSTISDPMYIQGPIINKHIEVDCSKSTQFYSALKLCAIDVEAINVESSEKYISLTNSVIREFKKINYVKSDMSGLCYAIAYGLCIDNIKIENLLVDSQQADYFFYEFFESYIIKNEDHYRVNKTEVIQPFDIDASKMLDAVPPLVFIASYADGISRISGLKNLVFKETNRLKELEKILNSFNVSYRVGEDYLEITGQKKVITDKVDYIAPKDHRMIMTAFLFLKMNAGGTISNEQHVKKSYPNFFRDYLK